MIAALSEQKFCTKCDELKSFDEFQPRRKGSRWRHSHCRACRRSANRAWDRNPINRKRRRERARQRHEENPEVRNSWMRRTLEEKPDYRSAASRRYAERYRNAAHVRAYALWQAAKVRASKKGLPFELTREWVLERVAAGTCEVTGLPFAPKDRRGRERSPFSPSIDRIEASLGYVPSNCRVVLWGYNAAKSLGTHNDVVAIARALVGLEGTE